MTITPQGLKHIKADVFSHKKYIEFDEIRLQFTETGTLICIRKDGVDLSILPPVWLAIGDTLNLAVEGKMPVKITDP